MLGPPLDTARPCTYYGGMTNTATAPAPSATFAVGDIVRCTSACDSDCVWTFRVEARTARFITIRDISHGENGEVRRVGITVNKWNPTDPEAAAPFGRFSMAPIIRAGQ